MNPLNKLAGKAYLWAQGCAVKMQESAKPEIRAEIGAKTVFTSSSAVTNLTGKRDSIRIGGQSMIEGRLLAYPNGGSIEVGSWCYIGANTEIWSMKSVVIGDRVFISHGVNIHDTTSHSLDAAQRHEHFRYFRKHGVAPDWSMLPGVKAEPVVIEDDCWIGFGSIVLKGVRIGRGSVVAAGSIVTKNVPAGSFYRCEINPKISRLNSR